MLREIAALRAEFGAELVDGLAEVVFKVGVEAEREEGGAESVGIGVFEVAGLDGGGGGVRRGGAGAGG